MVKLNLPTRPWVPQWLGIITMFIAIFPITLLNGAYTGSMVEVSNTLGILSEDITMAYYSASVGMAVAYPIVPKIRAIATPKTLLLTDLLLQIFFSLICAKTGSMDVIMVCSFCMGFLKAFVMLEFIILIRPLFSPKNIRSEFYAYFYPIVFSGGQLSMAITAQLAYHYQWQHMYYFVTILLLIAILFVICFFRYAQRPVYIPFKEMDGKSMFIIASAYLLTLYTFTYGKTLDWFASPKIRVYALIIPLLIALFIYRQRTQLKPFVSLKPLSLHKSIIGYGFMVLAMFLTSTSSLVTNYMNSIIRVDSIHANSLSLWLLPGYVLGAIICFWWFRWQRWRFRFLISGGMFCYVIYLAILYFGITPYGTYEMLYLPILFRGVGMMVIFIAFGVFVVEDLDPRLTLSNAFFLISFRSVLAPVLSASFFNNMLYYLQAKGMNILSENMTLTNPLAEQKYNQALSNALTQGHEFGEAAQLAANSLYSTLQQQSLLLALKTLIGYVLILALAIAIIAAFIPFHKTLKVAVVKTGDDMV
ncbi:MFS transporter [Bacteroides hominis]|uniref:MFS transporter n=1 Tax=Bacteroides hominis TaxID=2763023 RepID=UPI003D6BE719